MTVFLLCLLGGVFWRLWRIQRRQRMSPRWLAEIERRSWGQGQDGVSWNWPVRREE